MPIYASFESPSGAARCMYAFNQDGDYLATASIPFVSCDGGYPIGAASKINIRMDSTTSAVGLIDVSQLIIVP